MRRDPVPLSGGRKPAVLFADDSEWSCFFQLAAELRRAGFVTVRVTTGTPPGRIWAAAFRLLFDHTVVLSADEESHRVGLARLAELTDRYAIVDIQATETVAELIYGFAAALPPPHRTGRWSGRLALTDKAALATILAAESVPVPPILFAAEATPAEAAEKLGLPLVVKERVGYGGTGVHFAATTADLERLIALPSEQDRFYETYKTGDAVAYGGLAVDDGSVVEGCAYSVLARSSPTSPPAVIELLAAPELDRIAAALVAASGLVGLFSLGVIRDASGQHWVHDINARSFGSMATCGQLGAPLGRAYVRWLRGRAPAASSGRTAAGVRGVLLPDALRRSRHGLYSLVALVRWMLYQGRVAGAGYVVLETIRNRPFLRRSHPGPPASDAAV